VSVRTGFLEGIVGAARGCNSGADTLGREFAIISTDNGNTIDSQLTMLSEPLALVGLHLDHA
jgi:hypothetical protein